MLTAEYVENNWQVFCLIKHQVTFTSECIQSSADLRSDLIYVMHTKLQNIIAYALLLYTVLYRDHVETWSETESAWFLILSQIMLLPNLFLLHHMHKYKNVSLCFIVVWIADSWVFPRDQESICRETYECTLSSRVICFCMCGLLSWARVLEFML